MVNSRAIGKYLDSMKKYMWNPGLWAKDVCRYDIDLWQHEYLLSMLDGKFSAVVGCNGSGKDFISSIFGLFLLSTRPMLKGQVTGPSKQQIFDVVWAEMHKIIHHGDLLPKILSWEKTHVRNLMAPEEWFLTAKTASKRYSRDGGDPQAEGIQGLRGLYTLVLITEASGVEDPNFEAARSCCATRNSFLGIVGNGLRRSGFFYDIFHKEQFKHWFRKHVSYLDSSWTDKAQMQAWIDEYGRESNFCMPRCFGLFPLAGSESTAIAWASIRAAMDREAPLAIGQSFPRLQLGVDPARGGNDEAVIAIRQDSVILPLKVYPECSGPELVRGIQDAVEEAGGNKQTLILVDESGLGGAGVIDPLVEDGYEHCIGVNNVQHPVRRDRYKHWDDEQWMESIPAFLEYGVLPNDDVLMTQLSVRRWKFTGKNAKQRMLEGKKELEKRGYSSPDRAEAVMMAIAPDPRTAPELYIEKLDGERDVNQMTKAEREAHEAEQTELARKAVLEEIKTQGVFWPN